MSSEPSILDNLRVASPCPKLWGDMELTPEQSVRFCGDCKKNVYDVSKMSRKDAELVLQKACAQQAEGSGRSLCMQLYKRADGTIITDDCPVGLRRMRDSWRLVKRSAASVIALVLCQLGLSGLGSKVQAQPDMRAGGICPVIDWEAQAAKNPEIKRLQGELKALESKPKGAGSVPDGTLLQKCKLNLELAKQSDKCQLPMYSRTRYKEAWQQINAIDGEDKLRGEIQSGMAKNAKILGITETIAAPNSGNKTKTK
ncbi:MAG: hypothetical protein IPO31_15495 [Candidatus Obscuribacter sp.]|nr:hypothetical protein [Candidatus Obscuribacter sp.]